MLQQTRTSDVLVVGERSALRDRVADTLKAHRCTQCSGGADAYSRLRRERFDVVVADADLSDIDGLSLVGLLSELPDRPKIILLGEELGGPWVRHAFKRGVYDVMPRAFDSEEIRRIVAHAADQRAVERAGVDTASLAGSERYGARDILTGLFSRGEFSSALKRLRARIANGAGHVSVLLFDIDGFRQINVAYSRKGADALLKQFAQSLRDAAGDARPLARVGADRFVLALDDTGSAAAIEWVRDFRTRLGGVQNQPASDGCPLRFRVGVAACQASGVESGEDLIERATAAGARAKELGGNQTVCWSGLPDRGPSRRQLEGASVDEVSSWIGRSRQQLRRGYIESTLALVAAVEAKEPLTREHSRVVSRYCEEIARRMNLPAPRIESLKTAALLHDIGKIGVPDAVLQKPGRLTPQEFAVIQRHPRTAVEILGHASFLRQELPLILHHHERFDGRGYPDGLGGSDIPLGARILNVADSLDAMLSTRSYKRGYSIERAMSELERCAGGQFDNEVARVALDWLDAAPQDVVLG